MSILSFRTRMMVVFGASLLAGVFLLFVVGNIYVDMLQRRNVQEAINLAREQARQLRDELLNVWNDMPDANISDPYIRERMRQKTEVVLTRNKSIVWVAVIDNATGAAVVHGSSGGDPVIKPIKPGERPYTSPVEGAEGDDLEITVRGPQDTDIQEPVSREGQPVGEIRLRVRETPGLERIETTSRQITVALAIESGILLIFLLLVFWMMWRLFSRQVQLVQKNASLDQMAYVGTLASGLAHEIRNPLSAMSVNLDVMREDLAEGSPDHASELAGRIQREVQQLNQTLTSFLDFALPTRESFSQFSLVSLVDELLKSLSEQMRQSGIAWELTGLTAHETMITADQRLIEQAVRNILMNAMQAVASSVKKLVRVHVESAGKGELRMTISDTGPGIPPENLPRIFEVFFSTRKGGSGFGLAIARKVVEAHRGKIRAENNAEGLGASFIIELPQEP